MYTEFKNKLEHLDALICRKATGNPKELADKLGISERAWYRLRDFLTNDLQVPLSYCTKRKTYYYHREGNLMLGWRPLREDQTGKISGGGGGLSNRDFANGHHETKITPSAPFCSFFLTLTGGGSRIFYVCFTL